MAKSASADQKQKILEVLKKNRGAAMALGDIAGAVGLQPQHVLTLLGQMKGEVELVAKATMESGASMKWSEVDSKWRLAGSGGAKAPVQWKPRPETAPFGSEPAAELAERLKRNRLSPDRCALAAWLGHPGAREALGAKALPEAPDLAAWFQGFLRWGEERRIRALAAATRKALAAFEAALPGDPRPRRAIEAALATLKSGPVPGAAQQAEKAAAEVPEGPARAGAMAASRLAVLATTAEAKITKAQQVEDLVAEVARALAAAAPEADLRAAVQAELGSWALS